MFGEVRALTCIPAVEITTPCVGCLLEADQPQRAARLVQMIITSNPPPQPLMAPNNPLTAIEANTTTPSVDIVRSAGIVNGDTLVMPASGYICPKTTKRELVTCTPGA